MATYSFEAEPRIVSQRTQKYKEQASTNLMHNSRVYRGAVHSLHNMKESMTPQEKEHMEFEKMKEEKQKEMMKTQLDNFKKSKIKQTPYDIRPAATARIEVDLSYFLTDQRAVKPPEKQTPSQTDEFLPRPPSPPYVPKKTGQDVSTQIPDGDLFDFNYEVQPILNVVVEKTLEQAQLEVEEEYELESMRLFKKQYQDRKRLEENENLAELKREEDLISKKEQELERHRALHAQKAKLSKTIQSLAIAKAYLRKVVPNALEDVYAQNLAPEVLTHQLHFNYVEWLTDHTSRGVQTLQESVNIPQVFFTAAAQTLLSCRRDAISQHKKKADAYKIKCLNMSKDTRLIRLMYENKAYGPRSEFTLRLEAALTGTEYLRPREDIRMVEDPIVTPPVEEKKEEKKGGKRDKKPPVEVSAQIELENDLPEVPKYRCILINGYSKVSFAVANDPYNDTPKDRRKFGFYVEAYSEEGKLLETFDVTNTLASPGFSVDPSPRDRKLRFSDDEKVIVHLNKLPLEVHHIFFYVRTVRQVSEEFKFAWFRLCDFKTSQEIDWKRISKEEFEDSAPLYLCYRIYRQEFDPRPLKCLPKSTGGDSDVAYDIPAKESNWLLDLYRLPIKKPAPDLSALIQNTLQQGFAYTTSFCEELKSYRKKKLMEELQFKKKTEEQDLKKKKKPKKTATKSKLEPVKMVEYQPSPVQDPTCTFGPVHLDIPSLETQDVYEQVSQVLPQELLNKLTDGWMISVKGVEITQAKDLLKARTVQDLLIVPRPKLAVSEEPQEDTKEEADEDE